MTQKKITLLLAGGVGLIALIIISGIIAKFIGIGDNNNTAPPSSVTLTFWGYPEETNVWRDIINAFRNRYPHITIEYKQIPKDEFKERLLNSLAEGRGPDVMVFENVWVSKHKSKLFPIKPEWLISISQFKGMMVKGVQDDLIDNNNLLGMPIFIDTPALFYNKELFDSNAIAVPPKDWSEVVKIARSFTKKDIFGKIKQAGIALGAYDNVQNAFEIISSLIFQEGDRILRRGEGTIDMGAGSTAALAFYTSFANESYPNYSWSTEMLNSIEAFAAEKAVLAFGTWRDKEQIRFRSPYLDFGVIPFPQKKGAQKKIVYGNYYFLAISRQSKHPTEAIQFLSFAALQDGARIYLNRTGRAPVRRDLINAGAPTPEQDVFYKQALIARSWAVPDDEVVRAYFREAVNSVLNHSATPSLAISKLSGQIGAFLR